MKKIIAFVLVLVLVLSLVACGAGGGKTIKIGVLSPTSGDPAVHGVPVKQAAILAAEEINAAGGIDGKMIEIVAYDTKGDAAEAVNAYNRLRDQDKVVAIVGGTYSGATLGFKDLAVADGMPILSPTATNPDVTLNAPNVFRACYTDAYQGSVAATFAIETLGAKKPGILRGLGNAYAEGLADNFIATCEANGIEYVDEGYAAESKDLSAQLSKMQEAGIDALFIPDYTNTVGPILVQAANMGLDVTCLGGDGWDGITDEYAAEAEGFYFANHYAATDEAAVVQNFIAAYSGKYDETPNALGALAYDAVYLMAAAIDAAGSTDSAKIVDALAASSLEGVTGDISFDANGDPIKSVAMITIKDGALALDSKVAAK
jgi:branched-chain amino acid transport system substrate-binding protein